MTPRLATLALLLLPLGGCMSDNMNDPLFQQGYDMGCSMAHSSRDTASAILSGKPDIYRHGFMAGFNACGGGREIGQ